VRHLTVRKIGEIINVIIAIFNGKNILSHLAAVATVKGNIAAFGGKCDI
jgi:hypothetical protein